MRELPAARLPRLFVDTWGWLSLEDSREPAFHKVNELRRHYAMMRSVWVTTDYVLDETITRLFGRRPFDEAARFCNGIIESEKEGILNVEPITPERFQKAYALRLRYRDKPSISFTDLTSFVVMRDLGIRHALTAGAHFSQVHLGFHVLP